MAKVKFIKEHSYSLDGIKINHFKSGDEGEVRDVDVEKLIKKGKVEVEKKEAVKAEPIQELEVKKEVEPEPEAKKVQVNENKKLKAKENK